MTEKVEISFSVDPDTARKIAQEIVDAKAEGEDEWVFEGGFDIDDAEEIRKDIERQIQQIEVSQEHESYEP